MAEQTPEIKKPKTVAEHGYVRLNVTSANFETFGVKGEMTHGKALEAVRETLKSKGLELVGTVRTSKYSETKADLKLDAKASKDDIIKALLEERAKGKK